MVGDSIDRVPIGLMAHGVRQNVLDRQYDAHPLDAGRGRQRACSIQADGGEEEEHAQRTLRVERHHEQSERDEGQPGGGTQRERRRLRPWGEGVADERRLGHGFEGDDACELGAEAARRPVRVAL